VEEIFEQDPVIIRKPRLQKIEEVRQAKTSSLKETKAILDLENFAEWVDTFKVFDNLSQDEGWALGKPVKLNLENVIDAMLEREVYALVQELGPQNSIPV